MKLIPRRKKDPTTLEKSLAIFSKVFQALAAVRMARGALRGYRFAKRLPLLVGGAVVAAFAAKKLRGGSGPDSAAAPAPSPSSSATSEVPTPPPAPTTPGATDAKGRAEAAVATSAGLADATATTGGEDGATDEDAGAQKPA